MKFCPACAQPVELKVPEGDHLPRAVCTACGTIHYENPRIIAGCVIEVDTRILMCKRAIEPRHGFWTLPAGYLELGETPEQGAKREAREEACAEIALDGLLAVYSITHISQVQLFYRARMVREECAPGIESLEVRLFAWSEIPWGELAFPTVHWALRHFEASRGRTLGQPFGNAEDGPPDPMR